MNEVQRIRKFISNQQKAAWTVLCSGEQRHTCTVLTLLICLGVETSVRKGSKQLDAPGKFGIILIFKKNPTLNNPTAAFSVYYITIYFELFYSTSLFSVEYLILASFKNSNLFNILIYGSYLQLALGEKSHFYAP